MKLYLIALMTASILVFSTKLSSMELPSAGSSLSGKNEGDSKKDKDKDQKKAVSEKILLIELRNKLSSRAIPYMSRVVIDEHVFQNIIDIFRSKKEIGLTKNSVVVLEIIDESSWVPKTSTKIDNTDDLLAYLAKYPEYITYKKTLTLLYEIYHHRRLDFEGVYGNSKVPGDLAEVTVVEG